MSKEHSLTTVEDPRKKAYFEQLIHSIPKFLKKKNVTIYGGVSYEYGDPFPMLRVFVTTKSSQAFRKISHALYAMEFTWQQENPDGPLIQAYSTQLPFTRTDGKVISTAEEAMKHSEYPGEFHPIYPPKKTTKDKQKELRDTK